MTDQLPPGTPENPFETPPDGGGDSPDQGPHQWKTHLRRLSEQARAHGKQFWIKSSTGFKTHIAAPLMRKSQEWHLREKLTRALPQDLAKSLPTTFEPLAMAEWTSQAFQKQGAAFYGKLLTIILSTYFLADLTALLIGNYIPEPPPAHLARFGSYQKRGPALEDYNIIFSRNLFNSQGLIPGDDASGPQDMGGAPVKTSLPFNLIGTVILDDETQSIGTIEDKGASLVYPVRVEDEIPGKARIIKVEARKVTFVNLASGRREFVDLPEDAIISSPKITLGSTSGRGGGTGNPTIEKVSPSQFNVARTEVDKALTDLNQVLTQARAVPNFENGMPAGYKLFQIVPGSIYDKLGLQNGDTICGLDGNPINDPGKAFELLGQLKTANHLELCVKRDGRSQNFAYDIR